MDTLPYTNTLPKGLFIQNTNSAYVLNAKMTSNTHSSYSELHFSMQTFNRFIYQTGELFNWLEA